MLLLWKSKPCSLRVFSKVECLIVNIRRLGLFLFLFYFIFYLFLTLGLKVRVSMMSQVTLTTITQLCNTEKVEEGSRTNNII